MGPESDGNSLTLYLSIYHAIMIYRSWHLLIKWFIGGKGVGKI